MVLLQRSAALLRVLFRRTGSLGARSDVAFVSIEGVGTAEVAASECLPTFGFAYEDFPFIAVKTAEVDAPECLPLHKHYWQVWDLVVHQSFPQVNGQSHYSYLADVSLQDFPTPFKTRLYTRKSKHFTTVGKKK